MGGKTSKRKRRLRFYKLRVYDKYTYPTVHRNAKHCEYHVLGFRKLNYCLSLLSFLSFKKSFSLFESVQDYLKQFICSYSIY